MNQNHAFRQSDSSLHSKNALGRLFAFLSMAVFSGVTSAQSPDSGVGLSISPPNTFATVFVEDARVQSVGGPVIWNRVWDGLEWKFNPQWESLSQSFKNMTGSEAADTDQPLFAPGDVQGSGGSGTTAGESSGAGRDPLTFKGSCWVWVDEDWEPSGQSETIGNVPGDSNNAAPPVMEPKRLAPFNRVIGEQLNEYPAALRVNADFLSLCPGATDQIAQDLEAIRRQNELYLGDRGRFSFNSRATLDKQSVQALPRRAAADIYADAADGRIVLNPVTIEKGFHWRHREGDLIDYNTQGQAVSYSDHNGNRTWLVRDNEGMVRAVVDANGRVAFSLHYTGFLLTEVRDYPLVGNGLDFAARAIKYQYDSYNRLTQVTDTRGYVTRYDYNNKNQIVKITDAEGHVERLAYTGNVVTSRTAPDGGVTTYLSEYDDTKKQFVTKITAPQTAAGSRSETLIHNRVGKLVRQFVNGRVEREMRYDTGARARTETNARGFTTRIVRNEFDQIVEIKKPDGGLWKGSYSALNLRLTEETDEAGVKSEYQRDDQGNLLKRVEAAGTPEQRTTDIVRNSLGQAVTLTRKGRTEANGAITPDAVWKIEYTPEGQISKTTDPEGFVRSYLYNRVGDLVSYTDPRGNTSRFEVDAEGNLTRATDAVGRVRNFSYDKVGNLVTYTDARSKAMQLAYDSMNRSTRMTNPVGGIYKLDYNAQSLPITVTDEDGRKAEVEYDNFQRLTQQLDGLGNKTQYGYQIPDGSGAGALGTLSQPTEIKYPTFTQQNRFDALERQTSEALLNTNQSGSETLLSGTEYDQRGLVKSAKDAYGKTRFYTFDRLRQLIETTDSLGHKTQALYDARGNLIQVTDAEGNVHRFEYDRNDRLIKETLPLGQATSYAYDDNGNLTERLDPNGNKTVFTWDKVNRLTEAKVYRTGNVLARTTAYTWDAEDNLTAWSDTDHSRPAGQQTSSGTAVYDDASRKTQETVNYPTPQGGSYTLSYGYEYSLGGYKTKLLWADGTEIGYGYTQHGELETVTIPGEGSISVNQFKWVVPQKVTLPGGSTQNLSYDGLLSLEGLQVKTPGQQTTLSLNNRYGKLQELKSRNRTDTAGSGSTSVDTSYGYDSEIRLTQAVTDRGGLFGSNTQTFTLDGVGNRIADSSTNGAWVYDDNNRLSQKGTGSNATRYEYDEAGNLTKKISGNSGNAKADGSNVTQYQYDTQHRLIAVTTGSNRPIARYGYDPLDRRIWKEQYADQQGNALSQASRTYYLYSEEGLIAEATQAITLNPSDQMVSSNAQPTITTQYGPEPDSEFTTGTLFIKTKNSNGQDVVAYYQHDHLNTPIQAIDKEGNVVWAAEYDAFGQASITTPSPTAEKPTITSNLRLPGQYEDAETGLYYNFHRYYSPETGTYITQDPIGLSGGLNYYLYANHSPLTLIDPYGLFGIEDASNFAAGFGDTLSFGLTGVVRDLLDIGSVDKCSSAYGFGQGGAVVLSISFGGAHLGRTALNQRGNGDLLVGAGRLISDSRTWGSVQRTWSRAVGGYRGRYQLHHWFTPQSAGGSNAGWNYLPVSPWLNNAMSNGGWMYNGFKASVLGIYGAAPTAAATNASQECGC